MPGSVSPRYLSALIPQDCDFIRLCQIQNYPGPLIEHIRIKAFPVQQGHPGFEFLPCLAQPGNLGLKIGRPGLHLPVRHQSARPVQGMMRKIRQKPETDHGQKQIAKAKTMKGHKGILAVNPKGKVTPGNYPGAKYPVQA